MALMDVKAEGHLGSRKNFGESGPEELGIPLGTFG